MIDLLEIKAFTNRIAERFNPDRIILFGSYAYGTPREGSDVDILIIMPFEISPPQQALLIRKAIGKPPFPTDLLVRHSNDIGWRYEGGDPLIGDALDKGIVLYDKQTADRSRMAG